MEALISGFFNVQILREALPYLAQGLVMTLLLCAVAIPLGVAGGLALALASTLRSRPLRWLVIAYSIKKRSTFAGLGQHLFYLFGVYCAGNAAAIGKQQSRRAIDFVLAPQFDIAAQGCGVTAAA